MKVIKVINNNMVSTLDSKGKEIIVMGCGLGFKAKPEEEIDETRIERVYRMDNQTQTDELISLFGELPLEHIEVANDVITYAKKQISKTFNPTIYLTLTDHISFAIKRSIEGIQVETPLLYETKRFYPEEYDVGEHAVKMMEDRLDVKLPKSEASSIAMHLINAELNTTISDVIKINKMLQNILNIIRMTMQKDFEENSIEFERFVIHLRYLAHRILKRNAFADNDDALYEFISSAYPKPLKCAVRIADYIEQAYNFTVPKAEMSYLAIHIQRNLNK